MNIGKLERIFAMQPITDSFFFFFLFAEWTICTGSFMRGCRVSTASWMRTTGGNAVTSCPIPTPTCHRNCRPKRAARARIPRRRAKLATARMTSASWRGNLGRWVPTTVNRGCRRTSQYSFLGVKVETFSQSCYSENWRILKLFSLISG